MMTGLRFEHYDWAGGREAMLRFDPETGPCATRPVVIAALPLFEEANRTRQFLVAMLRALANYGIGSVLPDLPGTGESLIATADSRLSEQRRAYSELAQQLGADTYALSLRNGALFDTGALLAGRWHLAPQTGEDVLRDLDRIRAVAIRSDPAACDYAGNVVSPDMLAELRDATVHVGGRHRVVRLEGDPRAADATYPGVPLWRRSEPGSDSVLAQRLAGDISRWIASCAG